MKGKRSMKKRKVVKSIISVFLVAVIAVSLYNLLVIGKEYSEINQADKAIQSEYVSNDSADEDSDELTINWLELQKRNPDVIAWLHIPDIGISYPLLQGESNEEYLRRDIDKKYSKAGCIFIDSSNLAPFIDLNTVIYGHNLANSSMFSHLKKYSNQSFADEHPVIYIYLPNDTCLEYQVFSFHKVNALSTNVYNTDVSDKADFIYDIKAGSKIKSNADETAIKSVITLSTCTNVDKEERYVLHAVLLDNN